MDNNIKKRINSLPFEERKKIMMGKVLTIIKEKEGILINCNYITSASKITIKCKSNHEWTTEVNKILNGNWCRNCFCERIKKTYLLTNGNELSKKMAHNNGGLCLSEYKGYRYKLLWQCKNGHQWYSEYDKIKKGHWCPQCDYGIKERFCRKVIEVITKEKFIKVRPKWLLNDQGNTLELDGYCEKLKIAFEYQGKQHYEKLDVFKMNNEDLLKIQKHDRIKLEICNEKNIKLIIIPYTLSNEEIIKYIINTIKKLSPNLNIKEISLNDINYVEDDKIKELEILCSNKGGKLLSKIYMGIKEKHLFSCKEGHQWEAIPHNIKNGRWCPICSYNNMSYLLTKITIEDAQNLALQKNGKCLSLKYKSNDKLKWECENGHQWYAKISNIKKGSWCRKCYNNEVKKKLYESIKNIITNKNAKIISEKYVDAKTKIKFIYSKNHICSMLPNAILDNKWCLTCLNESKKDNIDTFKKIAERKGGECLSNVYINNKTKLTFKCNEGHIWESKPSDMKYTNNWCRKCGYKNKTKPL